MANTESYIFANSGQIASGAVGGIHFQVIEDIKDLMIAGGWTLIEATRAGGFLYAAGWGVNYKPTYFRSEFGGWFVTFNDLGSCDPCDCVLDLGGGVTFGTDTSTNECKHGVWNYYKTCDVHCKPKDPVPFAVCDDDGHIINGEQPHGGHFTGTFETFAEAVAGSPLSGVRCNSYYGSGQLGKDRDGVTFQSTPDGYNVYIEAKNTGPKWNAPAILTAPGVGFAGGPQLNIAGGGYRLRSRLANGRTQFEILLTMYRSPIDALFGQPSHGILLPGNSSNLTGGQLSLRIKELYNNSEVEYLIGGGEGFIGPFEVIANPYTLFISDLSSADSQGSFATGGNSILATAPYTKNPNLKYCLLVIGPGALKQSCKWEAGTHSFAINGSFETYAPSVNYPTGTGWPGMMCRNFPYDGALLTTNLRPLQQTAWVMAPSTRTREATVLGVLWDSFMVSKSYPYESSLNVNGFGYLQVSRQVVAPECSLWMGQGIID